MTFELALKDSTEHSISIVRFSSARKFYASIISIFLTGFIDFSSILALV